MGLPNFLQDGWHPFRPLRPSVQRPHPGLPWHALGVSCLLSQLKLAFLGISAWNFTLWADPLVQRVFQHNLIDIECFYLFFSLDLKSRDLGSSAHASVLSVWQKKHYHLWSRTQTIESKVPRPTSFLCPPQVWPWVSHSPSPNLSFSLRENNSNDNWS